MVLLVVDVQKLITNSNLYQFENLVSNITTLICTARNQGIEVIFVRHDDGVGEPLSKGNDGFEIYDEFQPLNGEKIFDKTFNSPFKETGLLEYLQSKEESLLIVAGLQTDYCIDATIKCGESLDNERLAFYGFICGVHCLYATKLIASVKSIG